MISAEEKNVIAAKMVDGEDFFEKLKEVIKKHKIHSAAIVGCIGMMKDVELLYFKGGGKYAVNSYKGPLELVSLQGNIGTKEETGEPLIHCHALLSNDENAVVGGHLSKATVSTTNELFIIRLERVQVKRNFEDSTGLYGMNLK